MPCLLVSVILDIYMTDKVTPGKPCTHLTPRTVITTVITPHAVLYIRDHFITDSVLQTHFKRKEEKKGDRTPASSERPGFSTGI